MEYISVGLSEPSITTVFVESIGSLSDWNYYVFFAIAFYTGLRKGEIFALKWSDISDHYLSVSRSITQKLKGEDRETPPKNKSSIRTLQMPKPLIDILNEHKKLYDRHPQFSDDFRICGGQKPIRDSPVGKANENIAKAAGLKKIRIHDYRHPYVKLKLKILSAYFCRTFGAKVLDFPHDFNPVIGIYTHLFDKHIGKCLR